MRAYIKYTIAPMINILKKKAEMGEMKNSISRFLMADDQAILFTAWSYMTVNKSKQPSKNNIKNIICKNGI